MAADALSRHQHSETLMVVSAAEPSWLHVSTDGYEEDPETKKLWAELSLTPTNDRGFSLEQGVIRFKGRIWVGRNTMA